MIMTISFHASLLSDFTIIFAAAPPHGKTNLHTTFSFSRWAKPPNKEQTLSKTVLMKQTNSEFEVQSYVGFTAHLIAHIFSFQIFSDSLILFKYSKKIIKENKRTVTGWFLFSCLLDSWILSKCCLWNTTGEFFCVFL